MPPGFESLPLRKFLLLTLAAASSGCAFLPLESPRVPHFSSREAPVFDLPFREAVGVIHAHSTYSDGSQPVEAIARIAQGQGLDYLVLTDHNTLAGRREGKAGRYGGTLVLIDQEISTAHGHTLALGLSEEIPSRQQGRWTIEQVHANGGLGFIAHPTWRKSPWEDPEARGMTGLEIYDAASDIAEGNILALAVGTLLLGADPTLTWWVDRPSEMLALWDRWLARGDRLVGIGSTEAHGLTWFGLRLGPYGPLFKLVRNHLWIDGELTKESVYEALRRGRVFVAHDAVADARGFRFLALAGQGAASDPTVVGFMGDEVRQDRGLGLYAYLPSPGEISLWKDGKKVAESRGQHGWFEASGPGVYRMEATRKGKPWIYSNPIYVLE